MPTRKPEWSGDFPEGVLGERDKTPGGGCYRVTSLVYDDCIVYQESIPSPKALRKDYVLPMSM